MHLPRFRFTVRRLMVAVAIVALFVMLILSPSGWAERRRAKFKKVYYEHTWQYQQFRAPLLTPEVVRQMEYHDHMRQKYRFAARYPWLPVAPDPPEPK